MCFIFIMELFSNTLHQETVLSLDPLTKVECWERPRNSFISFLPSWWLTNFQIMKWNSIGYFRKTSVVPCLDSIWKAYLYFCFKIYLKILMCLCVLPACTCAPCAYLVLMEVRREWWLNHLVVELEFWAAKWYW